MYNAYISIQPPSSNFLSAIGLLAICTSSFIEIMIIKSEFWKV